VTAATNIDRGWRLFEIGRSRFTVFHVISRPPDPPKVAVLM